MSADFILPSLRPEIQLLPGPAAEDGSPTGILYDALHGTFDKFGWAEHEVLSRLQRPVGLDALHAALEAETTVRLGKEELAAFLDTLRMRGMLDSSPAERRAVPPATKGNPILWLLRHYLFFRVPLLRPDTFLRRTLWLPRLVGSSPSAAVQLLAAILALLLFIPRSGMFMQEAMPFITWGGALWLGVALVALKILHEFSHAYAAAVRGVTVRSMGIFFMVMTPIPYCDVTDSWRLPRRERMAISFAGVRAELTVATFSLLGWSLTQPGMVRDILMFLCTASLLATLFTNLNPGMRFDGYYLFSDLIGVDNLQQTAFAELRAFYRGRLLGIAGCAGSPVLRRRKRMLLVLYAVYTCLYRLAVYFGIAVLVYHLFPKVLGIALFTVEMAAFVVMPVTREARRTAALIRERGFKPRMVAAAFLAVLLLLYLFLPFPKRLSIEAVVGAPGMITLYAPDAGRISGTVPARGAVLPAGSTLLEMENTDLDNEIKARELEYDNALIRVDAARVDPGGKNRLQAALSDAGRLSSAVSALRARRAQHRVAAETEIAVLEVDDQFQTGSFVAKRAFLGRLLPTTSGRIIVAYLPEESLDDLKPGDAAAFVSNAEAGKAVPVTVTRVLRQSSREIEEPALMSPMGGTLPVVHGAGGTLAPATPIYRVEACPDDAHPAALPPGQTGILRARGKPRAPGRDFLAGTWRTLLKESGF